MFFADLRIHSQVFTRCYTVPCAIPFFLGGVQLSLHSRPHPFIALHSFRALSPLTHYHLCGFVMFHVTRGISSVIHLSNSYSSLRTLVKSSFCSECSSNPQSLSSYCLYNIQSHRYFWNCYLTYTYGFIFMLVWERIKGCNLEQFIVKD